MNKIATLLVSSIMVAAALLVVIPPPASAGNTMLGYHFNETDFDTTSITNGPADYAVHNGSISNNIVYNKTGYSDWFSVANLNDGNGVDTPANWAHSATTPWSWTPNVDNYIAVVETIDGVNGYSGVNYTGSTFYKPMTTAAEDYCPATNMTRIPTMSIQSDDGSTLVLSWKGQMEAFDTNYDLAADGFTTTMVNYSIYSDVSGSWQFLGYSDADCGDYNAAWDGQMTFTYAGWAGVSAGDWHFRLTPNYQWINYENDGTTVYECVGRGPTLTASKVISKDLDTYIQTGWNLINLAGDDLGASFATASALAQSIEDNTGLLVLSVEDWENGWVDYLRREGSGGYALISWHMSTDYALDTDEESYLVYCADDSGEGDDFIWEGLSNDALSWYGADPTTLTIPHDAGWNNLLYKNGSFHTSGEILASDGDFTNLAYWDYGSEGWQTDPGVPLAQVQRHFNTAVGNYDYAANNNSAGFFVFATAAGTWTPPA